MSGHQPTSAGKWKGVEGDLLELPSGNVIRVRKSFPVYLMLRSGLLSQELYAAIEESLEGELTDVDMAVEVVETMVCSIALEPQIRVPDKDGNVPDGVLSFEKLDDEDLDVLLARAKGAAPPPSFRDDDDRADNRADREDVQPTPKRAARPRKRQPKRAGA